MQNYLKFFDTLSIFLSPSPVGCMSLCQAIRIRNIQKAILSPVGSSLGALCLLCAFRTPGRPALLYLPPCTYNRYCLLHGPIFSKWIYSLQGKNLPILLSIFNSPLYLCTDTKYIWLEVQTPVGKLNFFPKGVECNVRKWMLLGLRTPYNQMETLSRGERSGKLLFSMFGERSKTLFNKMKKIYYLLLTLKRNTSNN